MATKTRQWHDALRCSACGAAFPREEFYWSSSRCRPCRQDYVKQYKVQHAEALRQKARAAYAEKRSRIRVTTPPAVMEETY